MAAATSIEMDEDLSARIERLASARHRSPDGLVREAVLQFIEREEKRDGFLADAQQAWRAYRRDGCHITAEQADDWLARLEAGERLDPPDCHS